MTQGGINIAYHEPMLAISADPADYENLGNGLKSVSTQTKLAILGKRITKGGMLILCCGRTSESDSSLPHMRRVRIDCFGLQCLEREI